MTWERKRLKDLSRAGLPALILTLALAGPASAQSDVLHGRVMGANGPVADLPVALHRVQSDGSGEMLDQTTTDSSGQFQFRLSLAAGDTAVYFAATRVNDNLYVGPAIKGTVPTDEYVIDVGPNGQAIPVGGAAAAAGAPDGLASGPEAGTGGGYGRGWMGLLAVVAVFAIIGLLTWTRRPGMSADERMRSRLVRLATLEEEHAGRLETMDAAQRADYEARRNQLRDELLGR